MGLFKEIVNECKEWFEFIFIRYTQGLVGVLIRRLYWRLFLRKSGFVYMGVNCIVQGGRNIEIANNVNIMDGCSFYAQNNGKIIIGENSSFNQRVFIGASDQGEIVIGRDVLIGPNVVCRASNHSFSRSDVSMIQQGHSAGRIFLGDNVWIGANVVLLPGTHVGNGSIIGAGAVVNGEIPENCVAVGIPAKVIKKKE